MLAWGRPSGAQPLSEDNHRLLEETLDGHSWTRALPGVYVIALTYGDEERGDLRVKIAEKIDGSDLGRVHFLMSPLMAESSGFYVGRTAAEHWKEINRRSVHLSPEAESPVVSSKSGTE
jgi:hypothetical protein